MCFVDLFLNWSINLLAYDIILKHVYLPPVLTYEVKRLSSKAEKETILSEVSAQRTTVRFGHF